MLKAVPGLTRRASPLAAGGFGLSSPSELRDFVLGAKQRLTDARLAIRRVHEQTPGGLSTCRALAAALDEQVVAVFERAVADCEAAAPKLRRQVALVAHGGYGRSDTCPFSDVDVMLLVSPALGAAVKPLAGRLVRDIGDLGLTVGHSVRTIADALDFARR
ncbi:MAG TPA: hypothetical protein VGE52_08510, partial [Pirellulales bacterium]